MIDQLLIFLCLYLFAGVTFAGFIDWRYGTASFLEWLRNVTLWWVELAFLVVSTSHRRD